MNQLTDEQIEKLFSFVRSKYVRWIDVQYEIVDHLATAIEEKMTENSELTFDLALKQVYSKFPITGFAKIVQEKESALSKFWMKKYFGFMLQYFKLPKIVILIGLVYIVYSTFIHLGKAGLIVVYTALLIAAISSFIYRYKNRKLVKDLNEKYLVTSTFLGMSGVFNGTIVYMPLYAGDSFYFNYSMNTTQLFLLACLTSFMLIWIHAELFAFPEMLKKELNSKYRHLKISYI